jgi:excisionase family DNA binding protein
MSTLDFPRLPPSSARSETVSKFVFEPLLDSAEAAKLLRIHPKTLQRMARNGEITGIHIGKLWRFRASELEQWLQKRIAG